MRKTVLATALLALCGGFVSSLRAVQPDLASADWSVNGAHNLASNPPSLRAVEDFTGRAIGESEENPPVDVCEFRFADLRSSGDLSLIVSVDPGRGCTELYIFDKTPTGFSFGKIGCEAKWPLIFAWTGNSYSTELGDQYKDYYRNYLKSVDARLAADSSELVAASAQTANPAP